MSEPKGQAEKQPEEVKPEGLDELIDKGFEEVDKGLAAKAEETKKEEVKVEKEPASEKKETEVKAEEKCKECPEGKTRDQLTVDDIDWKTVDYHDGVYPKPVKVDGKVEWYKDQAHHDELASMGFGFTKKTMDFADEKRSDLEKMKGYTDMMGGYVDQFNTIAKTMEGKLPGTTQTKPQTNQPAQPSEAAVKAKIYEEFDIDPEFAETKDKKYVDETYKNRTMMQMLYTAVVKQTLDGKAKDIHKAVAEARKEYPFEEVLDKEGKSETLVQFGKLFQAKTIEDPKKHWDDIAVECAKDIYLMQKGKETTTSTQSIDEMTPAQFKEKHPDLYSKISTDEGEKAVVKHEEEEGALPPSLKTQREVDISDKKGKEGFAGLEDAIEKGFKEVPESK